MLWLRTTDFLKKYPEMFWYIPFWDIFPWSKFLRSYRISLSNISTVEWNVQYMSTCTVITTTTTAICMITLLTLHYICTYFSSGLCLLIYFLKYINSKSNLLTFYDFLCAISSSKFGLLLFHKYSSYVLP